MDYKFTIKNRTGLTLKVNVPEAPEGEDSFDWTDKKDPHTLIHTIEILNNANSVFNLSGKMFASDPWFITNVADAAGNFIAILYTKLDGNPINEKIVINDNNNTVADGYVIVRDYQNKDTYSYTIQSSIRFLVSSDFHIKNNEDKKKQLNSLITAVENLSPAPGFYAICGDLTDNNDRDQEEIYEDFFDKIKAKTIICDGFGNHDTLRKIGDLTDVKKGVAYRNTHYRNEYLSDYKQSENDFHYSWKYMLANGSDTVNIYFFMLNNVAGYGERENDDYYQRDEANPFHALDFLKTQLGTLTDKDYYCLFFHTNFRCERLDSETSERWWTNEDKEKFYDLITQNNAHYVTSFFGHVHSTTDDGNNRVVEEFLDFNNERQIKYNPLYGYRCRCNGGDGAKYFCIVDASVADKILEIKLKPQNVNQESNGEKTDDGELYLLNHTDLIDSAKNTIARSVTLRFDIQTGKELDRIIETIKK
ncbi:MAG: metallophosphoesterase [Tannerella sp.]|jgi:predicted MPP superfamily phosphohydrolase|nr:metallophosphoesterase [Tannerella sp.]